MHNISSVIQYLEVQSFITEYSITYQPKQKMPESRMEQN